MLTWIMRLMGGISLGIGVGSLLTGSTVSPEQMVMDVDLLQAAKRILKGFRVESHTLGLDAITRVGPAGDFLTDAHTLDWMRRDEYLLSPLANREGPLGKTMLERAHERVADLLAEHTCSVTEEVQASIAAYVRENQA